MANRRCPSDLTDDEWDLLESHLPASKKRGRPRLHSPREILNTIFYVLKSGCRWRESYPKYGGERVGRS